MVGILLSKRAYHYDYSFNVMTNAADNAADNKKQFLLNRRPQFNLITE